MAACSTWGILQALNSESLIDRTKIGFMSSNSGSTWMLLPLLYNLGGEKPKYSMTDILGKYQSNLSEIDFRKKVEFPLFGYNIVNSKLNFELDLNNYNQLTINQIWNKGIAQSFFESYDLYNGTTKYITDDTNDNYILKIYINYNI